MQGGMEEGEEGEGGEAHLYSSVDCRVSAVVVHLVGKTLGFIYKNHAVWFNSFYHYYNEYDEPNGLR